jgi:hypothetical protein
MLFEEGGEGGPTGVEVTQRLNQAVVDSSETRPAAAAGPAQALTPDAQRPAATRQEISAFCSAIRTGSPLACGAQSGYESARACIQGNDAVARKSLLRV